MQKITTDVQLLQASLAGSTEAFGAIVERYQSLICGITYSATGNLAKSQELAQETFIRAWQGLRQLKDLGKFRVWLCTIARNLVRKSIKRGQRDVMSIAEPLADAEKVESAQPGPVESLISKEQEAVVRRALQGVPQRYREPMVLFYREQRSVSQVAVGLGLSEDAVRQRLSRGRKLLKTEVAALVEETLGRTRPGKVFTVAVMAALPALTAQTASAAVAGAAAKGAPAAKAAFLSGLSGAVLGPLLGLLGGLFGTWMSIKHTSSLRERKFMVKMSIVVWALLFLLIGLPLILALSGVIPKWVYWVLFAVFFTLLLPLIIWSNARQRQIQKEQGDPSRHFSRLGTHGTYVTPEYHPLEISKVNIYGTFGGAIFGPVCWIIPISFIAGDWLAAVVVVAVGSLIFIISTKKALQNRDKYWRILIWDMIALCALNLVVVNLRWNQWMQLYRQSPPHNRLVDMPLWGVNLALVAIFVALLAMFALRHKEEKRLRQREPKEGLKE